jgi:hypothetical protein
LDLAFEPFKGGNLLPRFGAIQKNACTLSGLYVEHFVESGLPFRKPDLNLIFSEPLDAAILRAKALNSENATLKYDSKDFPKITIQAPKLDHFETAYFNLNELPQRPNKTVEKAAADLAALLEIAWKLNRALVFAKTRLHAETGILIVQGSPTEIELAREAFDVLMCTKSEKPSSVDLLMEKLGDLEKAIRRREDAK